ncbi:hypothetical protein N431DRAFT_470722 [Stipitochalara longipes BDJ]|nr:hypothetical protein N431DRAFT_470722 [Stipitochalara longipes BDJ]
MPSSGADCQEWTITQYGTVMALAKHINPRINSSVLLEDIANTIDGGGPTTNASMNQALIGCGINGGQMGVIVNKAAPAYTTSDYKSGLLSFNGLIIKIVKAPS